MKPNTIYHGDCLDVMREMEENSIDAVICDPPYELASITKRFGKNGSAPAKHGTDGRFARLLKGFMGKTWDGTGIGMTPEVWSACARVAKPGAYLLAFGGTRTFHRLACAIEDAGWILRDTMMWVYGSGFPKSHDISKTIDHKAGAEREVEGPDRNTWDGGASYFDGAGHQKGKGYTRGGGGKEVIEDWRCVSVCPVRILDEQSGETKTRPHDGDGKPLDTQGTGWGFRRMPSMISDEGGASRFFYCAKASRSERNAGLEEVNTLFEKRAGFKEKGKAWNGYSEENSSEFERGSLTLEDRFIALPQANIHPTVKPIALLRYLCRLVTPPGGTVLDPFVGSGSTGCAAVLEGFLFRGIDREREYTEIAEARIRHWAAMA